MEPRKYMNSYLAGLLLGLVLLTTIYITGRGLGASGAIKSFTVAGVETVASSHTQSAKFYKEYSLEHPGNPLENWLVFEVIGVLAGAFVSGLISNRLKFKMEYGPNITSKTRIYTSILGGFFFSLGAQFGRGCTSGMALSGMAVLSTGGLLTMAAIFGSAYLFAYFFRKLWI